MHVCLYDVDYKVHVSKIRSVIVLARSFGWEIARRLDPSIWLLWVRWYLTWLGDFTMSVYSNMHNNNKCPQLTVASQMWFIVGKYDLKYQIYNVEVAPNISYCPTSKNGMCRNIFV